MTRAVVTGAASGIGRATALLLLERGAQVVAADRDEAGLAAPADAGAETVVCDVADPADRARLLDAAGAACDHLVNSAGIIRLAALEAVTEDDWDHTMAVNAKALFFLCQAFAPRLQPGDPAAGSARVLGLEPPHGKLDLLRTERLLERDQRRAPGAAAEIDAGSVHEVLQHG